MRGAARHADGTEWNGVEWSRVEMIEMRQEDETRGETRRDVRREREARARAHPDVSARFGEQTDDRAFASAVSVRVRAAAADGREVRQALRGERDAARLASRRSRHCRLPLLGHHVAQLLETSAHEVAPVCNHITNCKRMRRAEQSGSDRISAASVTVSDQLPLLSSRPLALPLPCPVLSTPLLRSINSDRTGQHGEELS